MKKKKMTVGIKMGILSLIIGFFGLVIAVIQYFDVKGDNTKTGVVSQSTEGKNSPIVNGTSGNVIIKFEKE